MALYLNSFALCLGAVALLVIQRLWASYRFRTLRWPTGLGFYGFRRNVVRTLRMNGWNVEKRVAWSPLSFFADKGRRKCAFICIPADIPVTVSTIRDFASIPTTITGGKSVVVVTLDEVDDYYIEMAARGGVTLIWYRNLAKL